MLFDVSMYLITLSLSLSLSRMEKRMEKRIKYQEWKKMLDALDVRYIETSNNVTLLLIFLVKCFNKQLTIPSFSGVNTKSIKDQRLYFDLFQ